MALDELGSLPSSSVHLASTRSLSSTLLYTLLVNSLELGARTRDMASRVLSRASTLENKLDSLSLHDELAITQPTKARPTLTHSGGTEAQH